MFTYLGWYVQGLCNQNEDEDEAVPQNEDEDEAVPQNEDEDEAVPQIEHENEAVPQIEHEIEDVPQIEHENEVVPHNEHEKTRNKYSNSHPTGEFDQEEIENLQIIHELENLNKKLSNLNDKICENVMKVKNLSKQSFNFNVNHLKLIEEFFPKHSSICEDDCSKLQINSKTFDLKYKDKSLNFQFGSNLSNEKRNNKYYENPFLIRSIISENQIDVDDDCFDNSKSKKIRLNLENKFDNEEEMKIFELPDTPNPIKPNQNETNIIEKLKDLKFFDDTFESIISEKSDDDTPSAELNQSHCSINEIFNKGSDEVFITSTQIIDDFQEKTKKLIETLKWECLVEFCRNNFHECLNEAQKSNRFKIIEYYKNGKTKEPGQARDFLTLYNFLAFLGKCDSTFIIGVFIPELLLNFVTKNYKISRKEAERILINFYKIIEFDEYEETMNYFIEKSTGN
ncbi:unnamed protein product [Brachionus calyciflorus]|uniref:Uncharacterized protein n=1 Tax=Brachionus calyciflorus TaxID=104777 RepID=A0A813M2P6_9BILA|nr:unnamed protein product [Brachionus calyciflorus]